MTQHYSNPARESDPHALPDIETFYIKRTANWDQCPRCTDQHGYPRDGETLDYHKREHVGWYWQSCSPGCLPDGDPNWPFESEELALSDARDDVDTGEED